LLSNQIADASPAQAAKLHTIFTAAAAVPLWSDEQSRKEMQKAADAAALRMKESGANLFL
jgi:hypothetical protein